MWPRPRSLLPVNWAIALPRAREIAIDAQAHTNCPAGHYAGCFKLDSTAKVPDYIGWTLRVPGRVVADPDELKVKMRKPGFLWAKTRMSI